MRWSRSRVGVALLVVDAAAYVTGRAIGYGLVAADRAWARARR